RIESQAGTDPFSAPPPRGPNGRPLQLAPDGEPGNYIVPDQSTAAPATTGPQPAQGSAPANPFTKPAPPPPQPEQPQNPELGANRPKQPPVLLGKPKPARNSTAKEDKSQPPWQRCGSHRGSHRSLRPSASSRDRKLSGTSSGWTSMDCRRTTSRCTTTRWRSPSMKSPSARRS